MVEARRRIAVRVGRPSRSADFCLAAADYTAHDSEWFQLAWEGLQIMALAAPLVPTAEWQLETDWWFRQLARVFPRADGALWSRLLDEQSGRMRGYWTAAGARPSAEAVPWCATRDRLSITVHRLRAEAQTAPRLDVPPLAVVVERWNTELRALATTVRGDIGRQHIEQLGGAKLALLAKTHPELAAKLAQLLDPRAAIRHHHIRSPHPPAPLPGLSRLVSRPTRRPRSRLSAPPRRATHFFPFGTSPSRPSLGDPAPSDRPSAPPLPPPSAPFKGPGVRGPPPADQHRPGHEPSPASHLSPPGPPLAVQAPPGPAPFTSDLFLAPPRPRRGRRSRFNLLPAPPRFRRGRRSRVLLRRGRRSWQA